MKLFIATSLIMLLSSPTMIFDFNGDSNLQNWRIVDDGVMGGLSQGAFSINGEGHGVYTGDISLDNNGGFSSLRHFFEYMEVNEDSKISIRLKGDGKRYEFRVKHNRQAYYSYIYSFPTSGEWEEIVIPLSEMRPSFRGRALNIPDFNHNLIGELTILFGNQIPESFKLLIDSIKLL